MRALKSFKLFYFCLSFLLCVSDLVSQEKIKVDWGQPIDLTPKNEKDFAENWIVQNGNWNIIDGRLESTSEGKGDGCIATFNRVVVGDYAIEFNAMIIDQESLAEGGDLSIIMSADSNLRNRYDLQLGGLENRYALIQMYDLPMMQIPFEVKVNVVYKIRAEKMGDDISFYCDGKKLLSCKNQYFLTGRLNGIFAYGKGKQFWDIKLYEKKMKNYEIDLISADRLLSKVVNSTSQYFMYADVVRMLYDELLRTYNDNTELCDRIYFRLACMEVALGRIKEAEIELNKIKASKNDYEVLLLKAKSYFLTEQFEKSKKYYSICLNKFKYRISGIAGSLKGLLLTEQAKILNEKHQEFFLGNYVKNALGPSIYLVNLNLKNIEFLKFKKSEATNLILDGNEITSLKPISIFKNLRRLSISNNSQLQNLSSLNNLSVEFLIMNSTNIKSIDGINRDVLTSIHVDKMDLKDLSIIKNCPNLKKLKAQSNELKNLSELEKMKFLQTINVSLNKIKDLSGLTNLKFLETIDLSHNEIEELSKVNFEKAKSLSISNNIITDISPLRNANLLEKLNINFNRITSLESLSKITTLKTLLCFKNPLTSFGSFAKTPPETFIFSIDDLSKSYIEQLLKSWSTFELRHHKRHLEILVELKKSTKANLKQFAVKKNGHYYLNIPIFLKVKDAHTFARIFGAHLISIVDKDEISPEITDRMNYEFYWIGLQNIDNKLRWSTGENLKYDRVIRNSHGTDSVTVNTYYGISGNNKWLPRKPEYKYPFIIEWDE
ncbi:MAG: hypothetical protein COA79_09630 [Planctomycetota bacterium]|nr:MAG: hypothetical protein COA79_09630 [Planctomycetota bacterium]